MFTIKEILLDGMKEADGAIRFPTLTWKFDTDERGFRQTAYEVQVSRTDDFGALVYTSGETASNASANVSLPVTSPCPSPSRRHAVISCACVLRQEIAGAHGLSLPRLSQAMSSGIGRRALSLRRRRPMQRTRKARTCVGRFP